jgi:hypothetical protein
VSENSAPWHRLITDGRAINVYAFAWRIQYITVMDICLMLGSLSLMTVRDLRAAYHLVKYGGCNGMASFFLRWITNHSGTGYVAKRSMRAGCDPGSCNGFCDKSLMAICVEGHVGRFSATQFGHKVSNTGLAVITDAVVAYASRTLQVDSGAFVDDFLNSIRVKAHESCQGLEGGCPTCSAALPAAQASMDSLDQMMQD